MSIPLSMARPILIRSIASAATIALVHSAIPATRYAAAWLPLAHLTALYLVLGPLQTVIHRPGATFSLPSWLSGALSSTSTTTAGVAAGEEGKGWRDAVVIGGFVAVMNYAAVRVFVGLDAASAIALLSLAIPISFVSSKSGTAHAYLSPAFLLSLAASSIAVTLSTTAGIETLHNRTYSFLFALVYLACTYYCRQVTGAEPPLVTVKAMRDRKAAAVALAGSGLLVMMFAVNGKERLVPHPMALPLLLLSAVLFVGSTISAVSGTSSNSGRRVSEEEHAADSETAVEWTSTSSALATLSLTLLFTAVAQGHSAHSVLKAPASVLLSQAFVFLAATAAALVLPTSQSGMEQISRNGSYSNLADAVGTGKGNAESKGRKMDNIVFDDGRDVESGVAAGKGLNGDTKLDQSDATIASHFDHTNLNSNAAKEGWIKKACWVLFLLPLIAWIGATTRAALAPIDGVVMGGEVGVKGYGWLREADYDIVVAYYDEDVAILRNTIETVKSKIRAYHTTKVIVYAKGPTYTSGGGDREAMHKLRKEVGADEVVALKNVGREGETYLNHITRHYDSLTSPLARQTLFIQPHLAWDWLFLPRMEKVLTDRTGFVSFGPYLNASCSKDGSEIDSHGQSHPRIAQIYSSFQGDLCPADGFSITWAGQFVASRERIWGNKKSTYANLLEFFHVPKLAEDDPAYATTRKEWIWKEGWWDSKESNPTLGHALERSWPAVFHCSDLRLAEKCQGEAEKDPAVCQCLD